MLIITNVLFIMRFGQLSLSSSEQTAVREEAGNSGVVAQALGSGDRSALPEVRAEVEVGGIEQPD